MIDYNETTHEAHCLDCGYKWEIDHYPKQCSKCEMPCYRYRKRDTAYNYKGKKVNIDISVFMRRRIINRKENPYETYLFVIDRMLSQCDDISMTVLYDPTEHEERTTIDISTEAINKIKEYKKKYKITTYNEVLWRLFSYERRNK